MATIRDVAAKAGVSVGTVSNYITGSRYVHPDTARFIKDAIEDLHYKPNAYAKNLRTRNNQEIGVVLPNIYDQYCAFVLAGIEKELRDHHYYVNLALTGDNPETERLILENFIKKDVCGLIITSCQTDPQNLEWETSTPTVFIDRKLGNEEENFVSFDFYTTIKYLLEQLHENGYQRIGLIAGPEEFTAEKTCAQAYQDFFQKNNLVFDPKMILHIRQTKEEGFRAAIDFLPRIRPQALIVTSQTVSRGVEQAADIIGLSLEKDLCLIAFGQEKWQYHIMDNGKITTMRPAHLLGTKAARLLINNIKSPLLFEKQQIILQDKILGRKLFENSSVQKKSMPHKELRLLLLNSPNAYTIQQTRRDFEKKTGIEIQLTLCEHRSLLEKLLNPETSEEFDVVMYDNIWLDQLVKADRLQDITSLIHTTSLDTSRFIPGLLQKVGEFNGRTYGIPFNYGPQLLLYRKDIFENPLYQEQFEKKYKTRLQVPKTWFEFNAISGFFTRALNEESPVQYGTSLAASNEAILLPELMPRIWAYGGSVFDRNGRPGVESPAFIKGVSSFIETFTYSSPQAASFSVEDTVEQFYLGEVAMLIGFASFIVDVNNNTKSKIVGKIGYDYIPGKCSVLGSWGLGIPQNSRQTAEAEQLFEWICDPDMNNYFTILNGQSALNEAYENDEVLSHYPWLSMFSRMYLNDQQRKSLIRPDGSIIPITTVEHLIYAHIMRLLERNTSVETEMKALHQEILQLYEMRFQNT